MAKKLIMILFVILFSCTDNKTYLTEIEKEWNPYARGQSLIFESNTGILDSIFIDDVVYQFPEGFSVLHKNEILNIIGSSKDPRRIGKVKNNIFSIRSYTSESETRFKFSLTLGKTKFHTDSFYTNDSIFKLPNDSFSVPYGKFNDVIIIKNKIDYSNIEEAIEVLYWSKSNGYIGFDKYDGTSWKLKNVISGNVQN